MSRMTIAELPATPLFAGVADEDWPDLLGHSVRLEALTGEPIFLQGEEADAFYVVISGLVEVGAQPRSGRAERVLAHLGPGAVLGETSIFLGGPHSATVRAVEPTVLLRFAVAGFMEMVETRHRGAIRVLFNVGHALAVRLRSADALITDNDEASTPTQSVIENTQRARKVYPLAYI